ncbi:glycosyltransferase family A protein, partial [Pseudothermotoga sp.]|uniref:glycosyltransferase family 2 protein n=1 Tax=Pseudothermotoga sp. TaxID=2033661 RepID=UPI0031F70482
MENILVTFVVPAYNVERYIPKTLNSLLSQTDKDFEIIVVNDGSTDNTYAVVKDILEKSDFRNYKIITNPNGGPSSARNTGIKEAQGEYIIFLDGDDYVSPNLVERIRKVISTNKVDVICWKFQRVDEDGKPSKIQ